MAWEIQWNGYSVDYIYKDESFEIDSISLKKRIIYQEPSGGYQEPDDDIMEDIYVAESEHGVFEWSVVARRSGFNSYADIEDVQLLNQPQGCDSEDPSFEISNS